MSRFAHSLVAAVALLCLAAGVAAAQEAVPLAFKYAVGDVVVYEVTLSGSGGLRAPDGQLSPAGIQGSFRASMTVTEVRPDGSARVQLRIPRVDLQVNVGQDRGRFSFENGKVRWFSNGREQAPPDADMSQLPVLSVPLEFIIATNGRLLDVIVPQVPGVAKMQQMAPGLGAPQMKDLGDSLFPDTPVKVGETWRKTGQITPLGPTMPVTVTNSRTLDAVTNDGGIQMARISGYGESRFRSNPMNLSPGGGQGTQMTVAVPDLRLTATSTEFLNLGAGRLIRGDYDFSFLTRVSVGAGAQTQEGSIEARLHATVQAR